MTTTTVLRETGIPPVGEVPWGTHFCHFFETTEDLLDTVLPFFKAGLESREFCLWVVAEPLTTDEARSALKRIVPDLDRFLADGSIEIYPAGEWYLRAGAVDLGSLIEAWDERLARAMQRGFSGMRANASEAWLREKDWRDFSEYEERLNEWITDKPMIVSCSYPLATSGAAAILDVARTHNFAMAKRKGAWEVVETPEFREAKTENRELRIRHRWQCAVADLGQAAIRATGLAALMDKAAAIAAETLDADLSAVAELLPDRDEFRVLAGVGWRAGYVGSTVSALGTPGRYMLGADEAIVVGDLTTDTRFERPAVLLEEGVVSVMAVIIRGRTRPWGLLSVHSKRLRAFSPDEVGFLQSLANVLALAVERHEVEAAQLREQEERSRLLESESRARADAEAALERLRAIQSITDAALSRLGLNELLHELLARLRNALGGEFACVQLIDERRAFLSVRAADGVALDLVAPVRVPLGQAVAGRIAADGQPRIVYDLSTIDVSRIEGLPPELHALLQGSMLGTPLQVEGRVIGVLSVASVRLRRFTEDDLRLLQVVADRVAPAIERGRLAETVRTGREQLKALSRRLLTAQEEERRRLAVELHDELGQVLTAGKISLDSLARESGAPAAPAHLRDATASVDRAMESVRDLALDLRPSLLDDLGLGAAVRWHVDKFAGTTHIETHLSIDAIPRLRPDLEIACFRVAQEALTNVARHAQARNVWVDLHLDAEALELRVRDDGIGFDANLARERATSGASMGLLGMQERVALAGGEYELSTRPEGGTEVRARFRLGEKARGTR